MPAPLPRAAAPLEPPATMPSPAAASSPSSSDNTTPVPLTYPPLPALSASTAAVSAGSPPPPPPLPVPEPETPMVGVTILVISGQRKTFRFQGETTVGRVKEYIWNMWPQDWTEPPQPPSPSYFRLIYRGRMLDDEATISSAGIPVLAAPKATIVHLSIRTFLIAPENDDKSASLPSNRPPLHARPSSRIRTLRGAGGGASGGGGNADGGVSGGGSGGASGSAGAGAGGARREEHGGGCGCVVM